MHCVWAGDAAYNLGSLATVMLISLHKLNDKDLDQDRSMKKALLTAIHHYHHDKQDKEKHGMKWAVLCEEITKLLNAHYETRKFPPGETESE